MSADDAAVRPFRLDHRMTYADVANLAEVQRPVVSNWARRHADFPAPISHKNGSPLVDGFAVAQWLIDTDHGNADPRHLRAELALHSLTAWGHALPMPRLIDALTALICLRPGFDGRLGDADWSAILDHAADLDEEDELLLHETRAIPESLGPTLAALTDELIDAAYSPTEAFDWILDARRRALIDVDADRPAPAMIMALARLSGVDHLDDGSVVALPNVGTGGLVAAMRSLTGADLSYLTAETDPRAARITRRRLLASGVPESLSDIAVGDELAVDVLGDPDVLVGVVPFAPGESRDAFGVLRTIESWSDLLPDDRAAVVLGPADVLSGRLPKHGDADRLRRSFLSTGLLKAVVTLPGGVIPHRPAHRTAVWVLVRTPKADRRGLVLVTDHSARPLDQSTLDSIVDDVAIWRSAGWNHDPRHQPRDGGVLPASVLDDPGAAFEARRSAFHRHGQAAVERPARIDELEIRLDALRADDRADDVELRTRAMRRNRTPSPRTTAARLVKERRLRIRPGHRIAAEHVVPDGHYPVIGPDELIGAAQFGSRRVRRDVLHTVYEHAEFTEPGDVIVTAVPDFAAHIDEEGLSVVVYPAKVLRPRRDTPRPVRPHVLAALLGAAAARRPRAAGSVRAPTRIEDLSIPDLNPIDADHYETLSAWIERRRSVLREQIAVLGDLGRLTAAGFDDDTLTIAPDPTIDRP